MGRGVTAAGGLTSTVRGAGQTLGSTLVAVGLALIAGVCSFSVLGAHVKQQRFEDLAGL